ncbi:MAG: DUF1476 domain-containing protein [Alphaproteobacteria bacterium]|nr:DUF1476 domain-containing protein [Alphaproteobacteria bacterium]
MTQFNQREQAFEAKFKQDQELQFKVTARRNKLLGLWAAQQLGLEGGDAEAYAKEVVASDFDEPGDDDVLRKVQQDIENKGIAVTEKSVRAEMLRLMDQAKTEIAAEI